MSFAHFLLYSKNITAAAFHIYALHGEDAAKRLSWRQCIK